MNPINVLIAKLDQSSLWQKEVILKRNEYLGIFRSSLNLWLSIY